MNRLSRLEYLALLAIASSLTAVWLGLWVQWSLGAWFYAAALPPGWPAGLALAGLASAIITDLALGHGQPGRSHTARPAARIVAACLGGLVIVLLVVWALGSRLTVAMLRSGPDVVALAAPGAPAFLAALYAWWQGEQIGRSPLGNQALRSAFYTGVIALVPLLVLNSLLAALSSAQLLGALLLFFGLGLSGLALTSLRHLRQQQRTSGLAALALNRQWLMLSAVVIGLVLGAGLITARWVAPEALQRLAAALAVMAQSLAVTVGFLLGPLVAWLTALLALGLPGLSGFLERFITYLALVILRLQSLLAVLIQLVSVGLPRVFKAGPLGRLLASPAFQAGLRWAGLLVVVALAVLVFWLAMRRLWGPPSGDVDEQRDSVLSGQLLLAQLRGLFRRRPRRPAVAPDYLALSGAPDDARRIIRQTYQAMLEWARSLRLPRAAGQTPRAYAQMLAGAVPEGHDAIDLLTQAYVLARYAAEMPSLEQARRAEGALARLKALHS